MAAEAEAAREARAKVMTSAWGWIWFFPSKKYTLPSQALVDTNKNSLREKVFSLLWGEAVLEEAQKLLKIEKILAWHSQDLLWSCILGGRIEALGPAEQTGVAGACWKHVPRAGHFPGRAFGTCLGLTPVHCPFLLSRVGSVSLLCLPRWSRPRGRWTPPGPWRRRPWWSQSLLLLSSCATCRPWPPSLPRRIPPSSSPCP